VIDFLLGCLIGRMLALTCAVMELRTGIMRYRAALMTAAWWRSSYGNCIEAGSVTQGRKAPDSY
jgi:hypothetical protein